MTSFKLFTAEIVVEVVQRFKEQYERCQGDENAIAKLKQKISKALQVQDMEQESATEDILTFALSQGVSLEMIKVKAGSFMMGSPKNEYEWSQDEKLHKVTLTKDYWLGKFPVTRLQYKAVMNVSLSRFKLGNRPVVTVSWEDAKDFCDTLNFRYKDKLPVGYKFDLPTEAQWEYACRAGTTTAYCWGNSCNGSEANCHGHYPFGTACRGPNLGRVTEVGRYAPNDWGFYDMHGNVFEWCQDWYDSYSGDVTDPVGPSSGEFRVCRGGSWDSGADDCRSAHRGCEDPISNTCGEHYDKGFRLALVPVQ